ncbi:MAG: hydantoinase/oxoprolinase family protein [Candidatus Adiutrix sp.]|jgi:N-methylhydantoinase A/oxoprolinase/acetone carboxylase beta subunit|nr:hydantoinase/oxoprolinase family protein [Candidatus Adiutrix sp.]
MYLGLDVGGSHTDAALLDEKFEVVKKAKAPTRANDVLPGLLEAMAAVLAGRAPAGVRRLSVSSTLGLNSILTGQAEAVGVLATGGPGLSPAFFSGELPLEELDGAQNHLGETLSSPSEEEAASAARRLLQRGVRAFAVISKFGPKNPALEELMAAGVTRAAPRAPLTLASRLSGRLNFPRRLNTAVFNSAIAGLFADFAEKLAAAAVGLGLNCPIFLLTAAGGATPLAAAADRPVTLIAAGPSASLLGVWAMSGGETGDSLMLDVGGTSTDIAVMADGRPLMTGEGLTLAGKPTLVRALLTSSIAVGGDSALSVSPGAVAVGPEREGPALALKPEDLGRRRPTLTDALNVLKLADVGDGSVSRLALAQAAAGRPPEEAAGLALAAATSKIKAAADELMAYVNSRPVYTVDEMLLGRRARPVRADLVGGPAEALAAPLSEAFGFAVKAAPEAEVAGAVGAARARPMLEAELYADTGAKLMTIPSLGLRKRIDAAYDPQKAGADLLAALKEALADLPEALPPRLTSSETFQTLEGYGRHGRIMRLTAQAAPGVLR